MPGVLIPIIKEMGITYPQGLGITFLVIHRLKEMGISYPHLMWITYVPLESVGSVDNLSTMNVFNSTARAIFCGRSSFLL